MSDEYDQEDQPCLTYGEAWEIQRTVGSLLNHHSKCSSVPGHHPLSGPALLCDCGVIERFWNHRRFAKIERELAEVTKQRDELVRAIRKHKQTLAFTLDYCDVELYKALEEIAEGGAA